MVPSSSDDSSITTHLLTSSSSLESEKNPEELLESEEEDEELSVLDSEVDSSFELESSDDSVDSELSSLSFNALNKFLGLSILSSEEISSEELLSEELSDSLSDSLSFDAFKAANVFCLASDSLEVDDLSFVFNALKLLTGTSSPEPLLSLCTF
eukprot:NODE_55_length_29507_cov_0.809712.p21 type:complete len:154 gc:universal NODE_55_length_29507_cov_0.809712:24280-23819(-)